FYTLPFSSLFFYYYLPLLYLHSFPTRRSSDLLRRGNDVAGRLVRRQPAHARDHLQFHASARAARGSGRETRARRIHTRSSSEISTGESPDGRTDRAPGSDCFLHQPRRSHDISDR